jgi:hypothetical protein
MSESNGAVRAKKPQLSESIERLDGMIDELAVAIPGAVAESVREALGPAFAAAVRDAVKAAVAEAMKELGPAAAPAPAQPTRPAAARKSAAGAWANVKAVVRRLRRWAVRVVGPVIAHAALGWAAAKMVGSATLRSRAAALATALSCAAAGLVGWALGPVGASALLALLTGSVAATAAWAAPTIRLFAALGRDD